MAKTTKRPDSGGTAALEDLIEQRDHRIAELRRDLDEAQELISQLRERLEDNVTIKEQWIEAFEMTQADDGAWIWDPSFVEGDAWLAKCEAIVREWNKIAPVWNAKMAPRNVGRPLAASDAQVTQVRKLHKGGASLRGIAEETSLGVATVRTIIAKANGTDRTTRKYLERITLDRSAVASWTRRKRIRDGLPKRINEALKQDATLIRAAKGLGK